MNAPQLAETLRALVVAFDRRATAMGAMCGFRELDDARLVLDIYDRSNRPPPQQNALDL